MATAPKDASSDRGHVHLSHGQVFTLAMLVVITFAFMGFVFGINEKPVATEIPHVSTVDAEPRAVDQFGDAVSYSEIVRVKRGPNATWVSHLSTIERPSFDPQAPLPEDPASVAEALEARAQRRAFDGAPPVVPHPIDQMTSAACLACHREGIVVGDKIASRMSHEAFGSCTQCHVEQAFSTFGMHGALGTSFAGSTFDGVKAPRKGHRAYPEAPPMIPHTTQMRENCLACHGAAGSAPLRTSHPFRVACQQCHVPSAEIDQRDFLISNVLSDHDWQTQEGE